MALTSPKMGLRVWDQLNDPYDHDQLADNWSKVDQHDHTPGRGVPVPSEGIADGAITSAKLATGLDTSDVNNTYKTVVTRYGSLSNAPAGQYIITPNGSTSLAGSTSLNAHTTAFYVDPANYNVAGRTTVFRLLVASYTNSVSMGTGFGLSLAAPSMAGGSGVTPYVSGIGGALATASYTTPAISSTVVKTSSDFALPGAGSYVMYYDLGSASAATSVVATQAILQVRQVA